MLKFSLFALFQSLLGVLWEFSWGWGMLFGYKLILGVLRAGRMDLVVARGEVRGWWGQGGLMDFVFSIRVLAKWSADW